MKKNLRIASAAAAALLAVAPVAASAVNPANASVTVDGNTASTPSNTTAKADGTITVNINLSAHDGTKVGDAIKSAKVTLDGVSSAKLGSLGADNTNVEIFDLGTDASPISNPTAMGKDASLTAGHNYQIQINPFSLSGLTTGNTYAINGGTISGLTADSTTHAYKASDLNGSNVTFKSDTFKIYDTTKTGDVSFTNSHNSVVSNGSIKLSDVTSAATGTNKYKVSDIATAIENGYAPVVDNGNASVSWDDDTVTKEVKKALTNDGVDVASDGTFTAPAGNVVIPVTATAENGNKATLRVTLIASSDTTPATDSLKILTNPNGASVDGKPIKGTDSPYTLQLDPNSTATASTIASQFSATYDGINNSTATGLSTPVTVKSTNLNTAVVGNYQVVLTATNPLTNASKDVTVNVTVGNPGKTATVEAGSDVANVVTIDGNNVSSTSNSLANGAKVATYGTVSVNGTSYTRINSDDSNEYVLTKYVDGSIKPSESKTTSLDVMYKSAIYDENGKSTGKHIKGYTSTEFEADKDGNPVEKTINGGKFLKLAGNKGYVRTRNVRGSKMTLKKNAYVYKSNGRRANKKLLKKGSTIPVFGGQYRAIRHYRKNAVRIGHNQYVKVVNVNYKLAD